MLSDAVARLSTSCFFQKIFVIKCLEILEKPNKRSPIKFLAPTQIFENDDPHFLQQIVIAICCPAFRKV